MARKDPLRSTDGWRGGIAAPSRLHTGRSESLHRFLFDSLSIVHHCSFRVAHWESQFRKELELQHVMVGISGGDDGVPVGFSGSLQPTFRKYGSSSLKKHNSHLLPP